MKAQPDHILYLDESGDHTVSNSNDIGKRYLGLGGPFINVRDLNTIELGLDSLKMGHLPFDRGLPVLHRKDIMQQRGAFSCLRDPIKRCAFDSAIAGFLQDMRYTIIGVVIDKNAHAEKSYRSLTNAYHYCLHALVERYCGYLDYFGGTGHIVAESRGKVEDYQLRAAYRDVYTEGTQFLRREVAQKSLWSPEIEIRKKHENVTGLQMADLIISPVTRDILLQSGRIASLGSLFTARVVAILENKYNRKLHSGEIKGYGRVLLT